jgi:hypothetical protein
MDYDTAIEILMNWHGIEYLDLPPNGCKAILDARSGPWKLHKVCGRPRGYNCNGSPSSYCQAHYLLYYT